MVASGEQMEGRAGGSWRGLFQVKGRMRCSLGRGGGGGGRSESWKGG